MVILNFMAPNDDIIESEGIIQNVVRTARECAFDQTRTDLRPCLTRPETKAFMARYNLHNRDIRNMLNILRIEDYCFTSRETGKQDAYVFSPNTGEDYEVFLKIQITDGVLVLSFHEPVRPLDFPFRRRKTK